METAYPLSYRNIEELMEERGASVVHSTVQNGLFIIRHNWISPLESERSGVLAGKGN